MSSFFITGTDTGVGKTVVAGGLARLLAERGEDVGVMKPAETGWAGPPGELPSDARFLARAAGAEDAIREINPYVYREPLAPLVAARREGPEVDRTVIRQAYDALVGRHDRVLVEGAGGLSVPLTESMDMADLASFLDLPVLIVTRPSLGTLNHTFLTVHYARRCGLAVLGLVISGYRNDPSDIAEQTNPAMMEEMCGVPLLGRVPHRDALDEPAAAAEAVQAGCSLDLLLDRLDNITQ